VDTEALTAKQKNAIMLEIGKTDKMLVDGGDEALGLLDLCLQIGGILER
jgi:Replication factor C C-terminal domain